MKLRQLEIENFRSIRSLTWRPSSGFNLLLGAGDAGKTTVLDAIDFVIRPRWSLSFTDSDFTQGLSDGPIVITATVGELPKKILGDPRFDLYLRGWHHDRINDEPESGEESGEPDEPVLSIRLTVDETLEPVWRVYTDREPENGPVFLSRDRDALGAIRVGHYVDRHLTWGKGSALTQYTDEADNLNPVFADVRRQSSDAFRAQMGGLSKLNDASSRLQDHAADYGVRVRQQLLPGLDTATLTASGSSVGLYDGNIPAKQMGLGSRRLLTITMQLRQDRQRSVLLLDEVESALEPIRVRALIRRLIKDEVQVFATTHSPTALAESHGQSIWHTQWSEITTSVTPLDSSVAVLVQKCPNAILGDRSVVCEGKTELGFVELAAEHWEARHGISIEALGICEVYAEGRGDCGKIVKGLLRLGTSVALLADTDQNVGLDSQTLGNPALCDARFQGGIASESALVKSLDEEGIPLFVASVRSFRTGVWKELDERFEMTPNSLVLGPVRNGGSPRDALATLAGEKEWLKDKARAYLVLSAVWGHLLPGGPLTISLAKLEEWCYVTVNR